MENSAASQQSPPPERIRAMFDRIAPTYDLLNRLISFGLDNGWRRRAVRYFREFERGSFLDIAAGSGDVSVELAKLSPRLTAGADFSVNMLRRYNEKVLPRRRNGVFVTAACDALALPFRDHAFDGTITAFGIRNFADRLLSLREMRRVLRPGGIAVILELSVPESALPRFLYSIHAGHILPLVGRLVSGDPSAYRYLPESIGAFPSRDEFLGLMNAAGFDRTEAVPLTFGAATIFAGRKP